MYMLEAKNISKQFGELEVLRDVSLQVEKGQVVAIIGPSGGGKSTFLRCINLLETMDRGSIVVEGDYLVEDDGKTLHYPPEEKKKQIRLKLGMVFQNFNLFPHLSVLENLTLAPMLVDNIPKEKATKRAMELLGKVGLESKAKSYPCELSGGQSQRVAIARALVNYPKVLLLDEPLGALDLKLRKEMQLELKRIQQQLEITFVYVTHDQEEALTMSDTVVVMQDGVIQQVGSPQDIYNEPQNAFVADFIGESNIYDGIMLQDCLVKFAGVTLPCVDKGFRRNQPVDLVIRPEDIKFVDPAETDLTGTVTSVIFKGVHYEMEVMVNDLLWVVHSTVAKQVGETVGLAVDPFDIHIMEKMFATDKNYVEGEVVGENTIEFLGIRFERKNLEVPVGEKVQLVIDPEDIEVVSEDISDATAYLESLIYKGAYNELIIWLDETELILHSQNDEQVATDIGVKFDFDRIQINPAPKAGGAGE